MFALAAHVILPVKRPIGISIPLSDNLTIQTAPRMGFGGASLISKKAADASNLFTGRTTTA
jgi:hypothetical protein